MDKHLQEIEVEGFKSIKRLSLPMGKVNVLIGANGAGKTNFISLFNFLGELSRGRLKRYVEVEGGSERFFHFGSRQTPVMKLHVSVGLNEYFATFEPNFDKDSLIISDEYCRFEGSKKNYPLETRNGESGLSYITSKYGVPAYTKTYLEDCRVYHFHDTSNYAGFKKTQNLDADHYLESDAANVAPFLYNLKESDDEDYLKSYSQIIAAIQTIAPFFDDFYLEPVGSNGSETIRLRWLHKNFDNPFSANSLSDGTARFICMAILFLQPKTLRPSTIILDEPELGLHPAALVVLADVIKSVSEETQVICSTQSVTFANQFDVDDFIIVDQENGVSKFSKPNKSELEIWLEEFGVGDIWAKNLMGGRPKW